ncbi:MAG: YfiR family protein [Pseudomonadota bacterium]
MMSSEANAPGIRRAGLVLLLSVLFTESAYGNDAPQPENTLKAALVYKIMAYVTWPEEAFSVDDEGRFNVCGYGENPLEGALASLSERQAAGRPITLYELSRDEPVADHCHLLFVDNVEDLESALELTRDQPTLTISDAEAFAYGGGMIEIRKDRNRFGFLINRNAALAADLLIAAPLLELSTVVGGDK